MWASPAISGVEGLGTTEDGNGETVSFMLALGFGSTPHLRQGAWHRAMPRLERAAALCQELGALIYFGHVATLLGEAYTLGGRGDAAVPLLHRSREALALA
jgi:hypothetical protein